MDLFFKRLWVVLLVWPLNVGAVDITALYSTSCNRVLGIPLDADASNIYLLKIDGQIEKIPRYQVSVMATYPVDKLPIKKIVNNLKRPIDYFKIYTKYGNKIIPYIQGHPIQFYQDKISFISDNGNEIVIDRTDIWKIDIENTPREKIIQNKHSGSNYYFHHPHRQNCKNRPGRNGRTISIHPQEYTSDPITIKRQMDEITVQLDILRSYKKRQKFYAVPQIYKNITSLGYWLSTGGRHGASSSRKKNLTPILSNQYSRAPFSYQHIFKTGSAPLDKLIHANVQSHFYYDLKAEYFRFSLFMDPNNFLIQSKKYNWQRNDFEKDGSQHFESHAVRFGIDFGAFSFGLSNGRLRSGINIGKRFKSQASDLSKYYLAYRNHLFNTEITYGRSLSNEFSPDDYKFLRYNLKLEMWDDYSASYSFIRYTYQHPGFSKTKGLTNAIFGSYRWNHKYIFNAMLGLELFEVEGGPSHTSSHAGISVNLVF